MQTWVVRHPLATIALVALVHVGATAVWIWHHRALGALDPDEAGYIADALRYQRNVSPDAPLAVPQRVGETVTAPLVPLLAVVPLVLGPRDVRSALLVQPVLLAVAAVAAAGITRRLTTAGWAVVAGLVVLGSPPFVLAASAFWLGLGAAAAMALAVWALLCSDGLSNRWTWAFGLATGLMALTRTMALGFVPGLVLAGLLLAGRDPRRLGRLALALLLAAGVAVPWYLAQREEIFGYLVGYGYGARSEEWGEGGAWARLRLRLGQMLVGLMVVAPVAIPAVAAYLARTRPGPRWVRGWTPERREAVAVAVVVLTGFAALLSTQNSGLWFELPLVVLTVPLGVAVVARWSPGLRRAAAVWLVVVSVALPLGLRLDGLTHADAAFGVHDRRLARLEEPGGREAAEEWRALDEQVTAELAALTDRGRTGAVAMTGNTFLFNSNVVELEAELDLWYARVEVPDTRADAAGRSEQLSPLSTEEMVDGTQKERILVVVRYDRDPFTPDTEWRRFEEEARAAGWEEVAVHPMPVDGEVAILRHRSALAGGR
ncbi:hypothetical protein PO878_15455 [Iamia majanohamensis]|uniref:Glycosyltransferase RgtA/B/C/D-like domain-containing protein n=1 Tax=Iamia majanohamensis TaxID=467976 RepID=A0AAE9Y472_9ACTN|nr:hypothetical protein [Iamia majanohamensis]WCO65899.1 hypothetical protein PO878_15455 [Iamia majanohamensis]